MLHTGHRREVVLRAGFVKRVIVMNYSMTAGVYMRRGRCGSLVRELLCHGIPAGGRHPTFLHVGQSRTLGGESRPWLLSYSKTKGTCTISGCTLAWIGYIVVPRQYGRRRKCLPFDVFLTRKFVFEDRPSYVTPSQC